MKTFTQFLEQRDPELYEQMLNESKWGALGAAAMGIGSLFGGGEAQAQTTKEISPLSGGYTPGAPTDLTDFYKFTGPDAKIIKAKTSKEIMDSLKWRTGEDQIKYIKPENLANALVRTKASVSDVKEILGYFSKHHNYMTKADIKNILNVVPEETKDPVGKVLESERQRHQNQRDDFFKKHYPERIKGLDGEEGYFDSESNKGGDYSTHYTK